MGQGNSKPSIRQILHEFSDSLVPSPEYYRRGNETANKIFQLIQKNRKDVARVLVGGGIGKRTAISESDDFDLYIFLNNQKPPFTKALDEIRTLLLTEYSYDVRIINETTIKFKGRDLINFDLSVGVNLEGYFFTDQKSGTMAKIKEMKDPGKKGHVYGPSLAEYHVAFVRDTSAFAHKIIRLAKYWNKNVNISDYVSGRSLLIEMVALRACGSEEKDIFQTMIRFLELMADFENLSFYFTKYYSDSWLWGEIPNEILKQKPLVLDPVNPYNNLARLPTYIINEFSDAASTSLAKLKNWENFTDPMDIFGRSDSHRGGGSGYYYEYEQYEFDNSD